MLKTIYITKYALSKGIYQVEVEMDYKEFLQVPILPHDIIHSDQYCNSKTDALLNFEKKKLDRIKSLEKSLEKCKKMKPKFIG